MTLRRLLSATVLTVATLSPQLGAGPISGQAGMYAPGEEAAAPSVLDEDLEELLLEFRLGRLARITVRALSDGAVALLPAGAVLTLAEVEHEFEADGSLRASLHPGPRRIRIHPDSGTVLRDGVPVPTQPGWIVADDAGEVYLATPVLEALLDVRIATDWVRMTSMVRDPGHLPVGRRLARQARWERLQGDARGSDAAPLLELRPRALGGAVLDWGLSGTASDPRNTAAYSVGLGARALGGSLQVSSRSLGPAARGESRVDATYQAVFREWDWIRQVRLGDGFTTGPRLRDVRGVALTNSPYFRDSHFGQDRFAGRVGPGWEVELRQSGRVLDLTRADERGAFALDIPLRYGQNALQVVAFGPHGEVVTTDRVFLLGADRLPGGRFEWGLSGGVCRSERCRATGNLDLRYGLSDRWTVRGGAEAFQRDTLASVFQPYLGITGMPLQSVEVSVEGVRAGFVRAGATVAPSPWIRVRAAHTAFSRYLSEPVLHNARRLRTTEADIFIRPDRDNARLFLRGSVLRQDLETGDLAAYQGSLTLPVADLAVEAGFRREADQPTSALGEIRDYQFTALYGTVPFQWGRSLWVRGELEFLEADAVDRARARIAWNVSREARLEVGMDWHRLLGTSLSLSFTAYLQGMRSVTQMLGREGTEAEVVQYSQGTVYWNDATREVSLAPGPGVQRGGVAGYVFVDENGNGMRDTDEAGLPDVRVVVGGQAIRTDARGRHAFWDLVPFRVVEIWTDSTSIRDPSLVPAWNRVRVEVPPSSFGRVDLPVSPTREISGRVVRVSDGAEVPVPYARLWLVNRETREVRHLEAFSDGEFYDAGVRPGRYELRLDPEYRSRADLTPEILTVPVEVGAGGAANGGGPIVFRVQPGGGAGRS